MALSLCYGREFLVWAKKLRLAAVGWLSVGIGGRKAYLISRLLVSALTNNSMDRTRLRKANRVATSVQAETADF